VKRILIIAAILVVVIGFGVSYIPADILRPGIERALERSLGRRVEVGDVYISPLSGLGFKLEDVIIHEDPRAGMEPFAYVQSLEAHLRPLSLLRRRLEFSSLRLNEASINVVKTDGGPWNFQFLLSGAEAGLAAEPVRTFPAIKMRGGRVNFKFGDTTSVVYFSDADLDVSPSNDGSLELRFSGAPARTDRSAQSFGHFFVRGTSTPSPAGQKFDMRVELEPSAVEEVARLFDRGGFALHGVVALEAQLSGTSSRLDVSGRLQLTDVHRSDLPPQQGSWRWDYQGTLDLRGEKLELASAAAVPNAPMALRFRASELLSTPHWDAAADFHQVPVSTLLNATRHLGVTLPEKSSADGSVSGSVRYSDPDGLAGRVEMRDASIVLADGPALRAASVSIAIDRQAITLEPSTVRIGESEAAELEGSYAFDPPGGWAKITTRGLNVAEMRAFGLTPIPLLQQMQQGTWRGSVECRWQPAESNASPNRGGTGADIAGNGGANATIFDWSGEYELQNARIAVDGLSDPVRIQSASVSLNGRRVSVNRLRAKAGAIAFTGDYRWEPGSIRPHKFHILVPEADLAELRNVLGPTLVRGGGFLARALGLGTAAAPEWLTARRADGTVSIETLTAGDLKVHLDTAHLLWDGELLRINDVAAHMDQTTLAGDLSVDLSGRAPNYRFEGKLQDVAYKGGRVDFEGSVAARGNGPDLLDTVHGEGTLRGLGIAFSADADFRSVASGFELVAAEGGPHWKLTGLEVIQGSETYSGRGGTQPDGRLLLELASRGRQFRYTGTLAAVATQP